MGLIKHLGLKQRLYESTYYAVIMAVSSTHMLYVNLHKQSRRQSNKGPL